MRLKILLLIFMFSSLLLEGCNSLTQMTSTVDVGEIIEDSQYPLEETATIIPTMQNQVTQTITPKNIISVEYPNYEIVEMNCEIYLQSQWGEGPEDFGYYRQEVIAGYFSFMLPTEPVFLEEGDMFIPDPANNRIFRYVYGEVLPEIIPVPKEFVNFNDHIPWGKISVTDERIFIPFAKGLKLNIGVLSHEGMIEMIIEIPPDYPSGYSPLPHYKILPDDGDGFYVLLRPNEVMHYSIEKDLWEKFGGHTVLIFKGWDNKLYIDESFNRVSESLIESLRVEFEDRGTIHFLRRDILGKIIGIDRDGLIFSYYYDYALTEHLIFRIDTDGENGFLARLPEEHKNLSLPDLSISPNGMIYGMEYDWYDPDIPPRLIRCSFP